MTQRDRGPFGGPQKGAQKADLVTDGTTLFFGFGLAPLSFDSSNIYFSQEVAIHRMLKNGSPAISWTLPAAITRY